MNGHVETINCAESAYQSTAWLQVDLQNQALVRSVAVYSFAPKRRLMDEFDIRVGNSALNGGIGNPLCAANIKISNSSNFILLDCLEDILGRFVTLNTYIKLDFLEVCEFEVYGYYV